LSRAIVISNDEPDSSYGARRLAAAFGERFETEIVSPLGGFGRPETWLERVGADALVLSGSDRSVLSELPWMLEEEEVLRSAVRSRTPTLAICFGHQLLGKAFEADIVTREKRIGLFEVTPEGGDAVFAGAPVPSVVPEQHSQHVASLPEGFRLLATSDYCAVQAMRHETAPVYGFQFHPCYDDSVFDVDDAWNELEMTRPLSHDGGLILKNAVSVLWDELRRGAAAV
jgi:GMP synthase-like glutamine amidotransferase